MAGRPKGARNKRNLRYEELMHRAIKMRKSPLEVMCSSVDYALDRAKTFADAGKYELADEWIDKAHKYACDVAPYMHSKKKDDGPPPPPTLHIDVNKLSDEQVADLLAIYRRQDEAGSLADAMSATSGGLPSAGTAPTGS